MKKSIRILALSLFIIMILAACNKNEKLDLKKTDNSILLSYNQDNYGENLVDQAMYKIDDIGDKSYINLHGFMITDDEKKNLFDIEKIEIEKGEYLYYLFTKKAISFYVIKDNNIINSTKYEFKSPIDLGAVVGYTKDEIKLNKGEETFISSNVFSREKVNEIPSFDDIEEFIKSNKTKNMETFIIQIGLND